jgi:hypothetical protein
MKFSAPEPLQRLVSAAPLYVLFTFLISGGLYLIFPEQHYNVTGWGVLVKYILYFGLLALLAGHVAINGTLSLSSIIVALAWVIAISMGVMMGADAKRAFLYLIPVTALLAPRSFQLRATSLALPLLLVTLAGAVYEYFVLGGFARFHPTSYRGISIFINPNNLGITVAVLSAYVTLTRRGTLSWITLTFCGALVLYSGSKTGMAALLALTVLLLAQASALRLVAFGLPVLVLAALSIATGLVHLQLDSAWARIRQYTEFFSNINNTIFPFLDAMPYYADNAFIQLWIEMGLPAAIVYVTVMLICVVREKLWSPLWAIFVLSSMTTNVPYLFPLAYLFWFYVGTALTQTSPKLDKSAILLHYSRDQHGFDLGEMATHSDR